MTNSLRPVLGRSCALFLLVLVALALARAAPPETKPVEGIRDNTPAVHALTNVRIVTEPGKVVEKGTIVVRDGVIVAAGADVATPADARVWDLSGKTVYAGFIDAYSEMTIPAEAARRGAAHWNALIAPQLSAAEHYATDEALNKTFRSQGITTRLIAPSGRIIQGRSALVSTGSGENSRAILKENIALHIRLSIPFSRDRGSYPNSPMGAVALARQALFDADWYAKAWKAHEADSKLPRPERNDSLQALSPYVSDQQLTIFDTSNEQFFLRADRFAREFGLKAVVRGSGHEYRQLEAIRAAGRTVIVPLNFPRPPQVDTVEGALDVPLEAMMHWDHAPENPARLEKGGVPIALTSHGLRDRATFLKALRRSVQRGLPADAALRALTTTPANLFGVSDRLGTIAGGKAANLVVTDGDLFAEKTKIVETWVDGQRFEMAPQATVDLRGTWQLKWQAEKDQPGEAILKVSGTPTSLKGSLRAGKGEVKADTGDKTAAGEITVSQIRLSDLSLTFSFEGKELGKEGKARASAVVLQAKDDKHAWSGQIVWADGATTPLTATLLAPPSKEETAAEDDDDKSAEKGGDDEKASDGKGKAKKKPKPETPALFAVNYPLGDFGRSAAPEQPTLVLFTNASIWTCGEKGLLEKASLLVGNGKILAVGKDLPTPSGATVIDLQGKHISPGIIDCHSHMATDGGINETGQAITAEVRIGDFIDGRDIAIYRQLAGGVTAANVLHGSANPIGGQNQVIKLRWGALPEEMKFAEAPQGVKFALGENVKQSNWGERFTTRYPQSRMGVEQIMRDEFSAASDYQANWDRWNEQRVGLPPRRDLELEAVAEILGKKRWIHCHSYRQDEILALLRVCEEYKVRIGTLQHILEGYKVADAIARHGAMGSSFSDWWAYKFEVIDSIPHNGALMHQAGVVVSFNSDDKELARHLNHEAAKAVKYGGLSPEEALKFVTLNPAKQLRIEKYVGSLDVGKHADFVIWNGPPLSTLARCEQTWVDGRKYFDREDDAKARTEQQKMRVALIRKILESGAEMSKGDDDADDSGLWPRHDEFCAHGDDHDHHH